MKIQMQKGLKKGFTLIELLVVITIIAILASLAVPTFGRIQERGNITKGISNARQIITALRIYSSDHSGNYPDVSTGAAPAPGDPPADNSTANGVFRALFTEQILDSEQIFGCPVSSVGNPDGNIGTSPSFTEALGPRENHWMMTGGASDSASGSVPLVYENSAGTSEWDPQWNAKAAGTNAQGRSWSGGKIIIGQNDSSVALQQLEDKTSQSTALKKSGSDNMFTRFADSGFKVLPVEGAGN